MSALELTLSILTYQFLHMYFVLKKVLKCILLNLIYIHIYIYIYVYIIFISIWVSTGSHRGQKRVFDPLEVELQLVVSDLTCVLLTELQFSTRRIHALNL